MEESFRKSQILAVSALIFSVIFLGINIFWIITIYIPHCGYSAAFDELHKQIAVTGWQGTGEYTYSIGKTPYLGFSPRLTVSEPIEFGKVVYDELYINSVDIYPSFWGENKYVVEYLVDHKEVINGDTYYSTVSPSFEINEQGEFIPYFGEDDPEFYAEQNEKDQQVLKDKNAEIMGFIKAAKDLWGLEPKHDFIMGLKHIFSANPFLTVFALAPVLIPSLAIALLLWVIKVKIPFQKLNCELDSVDGTKELNYRRTIGDYEFRASKPHFLKNNGFLTVQKLPYKTEWLTLIICPNKKKTRYYALLTESQTVIRKAEKVEFEYICGKALSTNQFIIDHNEELADLAVQANLFWPI